MTATNDTCNLGPSFWRMSETATFVAYQISPPLILVLGVPVQIIALFAFLAQSKKEKAYAYQIYSSLSAIFELFAFSSTAFTSIWCGTNGGGFMWYMTSYVAMSFSAHVSPILRNIVLTNSLLASLFMSIDRLLALAKPFIYRNFKHRRNQSIAFAICILISVGTSILDYFRFYLKFDTDRYKLIPDEYANSTPTLVVARLRDSTRIIGLSGLIVCNSLICYFYKKQGITVTQMTGSNNAEKVEKRKAQEKTLLLLTVSQSTLIAVRVFASTVLVVVIYGVPEFTICGQRRLVSSVVDLIMETCMVLDFYTCALISKQFRKNVLEALPCFA